MNPMFDPKVVRPSAGDVVGTLPYGPHIEGVRMRGDEDDIWT